MYVCIIILYSFGVANMCISQKGKYGIYLFIKAKLKGRSRSGSEIKMVTEPKLNNSGSPIGTY